MSTRHDDVADEWRDPCSKATTPGHVTREPHIYSAQHRRPCVAGQTATAATQLNNNAPNNNTNTNQQSTPTPILENVEMLDVMASGSMAILPYLICASRTLKPGPITIRTMAKCCQHRRRRKTNTFKCVWSSAKTLRQWSTLSMASQGGRPDTQKSMLQPC